MRIISSFGLLWPFAFAIAPLFAVRSEPPSVLHQNHALVRRVFHPPDGRAHPRRRHCATVGREPPPHRPVLFSRFGCATVRYCCCAAVGRTSPSHLRGCTATSVGRVPPSRLQCCASASAAPPYSTRAPSRLRRCASVGRRPPPYLRYCVASSAARQPPPPLPSVGSFRRTFGTALPLIRRWRPAAAPSVP